MNQNLTNLLLLFYISVLKMIELNLYQIYKLNLRK